MTPFAEVVLAAGGCLSASLLAVRQIVVDVLRSEEREWIEERKENERERVREEERIRRADPNWRAAQRAKMETKRKLILERKGRLLSEYESFCNKNDEAAIEAWNIMNEEDEDLVKLAEEEALLVDT